MASLYEIEVTIKSAKDLKNVNWRYGPIRPYVVVWVEPKNKCSTRVDEEGDTCPFWDQTLRIPLPPDADIEDQTLFIDIVHAGREEETKPLIGSARLKLRDVINDVGVAEVYHKSLHLKRPSGRPHGKVDVDVIVKDTRRRAPDAYYAPPYGVSSRDYPAPPPQAYGSPYAAPPQPYYGAPPPSGYPYGGYGAPPQPAYGQGSYEYGQPGVAYGQNEKKSKFGGMGTGLAVGAVAGALGGLALAEGVDALEDHIADDVADRVEDDIYDGGDDF